MVFGYLLLILIVFLLFQGARNFLSFLFKIKQHPEKEIFNLTINRENTVGQIFIILSIIFFGESLLILNRYFSGNLSFYWVIFIVILISLILGYFLESLYSIIFGIIFLPCWWISHSVVWIEKRTIATNIILSGLYFIILIYYLSGRILEKNKKWEKTGIIMHFLSIPMLFTFLFLLSTPYGISLIEGNLGSPNILLSKPLTFFILLFFFSSTILLFYASFKNFISISLEFIPLFFILCFFLSFLFFQIPQLTNMEYTYKRSFVESFTPQGIFFVIFLNIITFSFSLLLFFPWISKKRRDTCKFWCSVYVYFCNISVF
ncbi:MAG TPA: hypothetical protein PKV21_00075 [bacterium]|nr:hypothetical protein [bacterium]HOM25891.1 hypothetical protein [bacterium]